MGCVRVFTSKQSPLMLSSFAACLHFSCLISSFGASSHSCTCTTLRASLTGDACGDTRCQPAQSCAPPVAQRPAGQRGGYSVAQCFDHFTAYKSLFKSFSSSYTFKMKRFIFSSIVGIIFKCKHWRSHSRLPAVIDSGRIADWSATHQQSKSNLMIISVQKFLSEKMKRSGNLLNFFSLFEIQGKKMCAALFFSDSWGDKPMMGDKTSPSGLTGYFKGWFKNKILAWKGESW